LHRERSSEATLSDAKLVLGTLENTTAISYFWPT